MVTTAQTNLMASVMESMTEKEKQEFLRKSLPNLREKLDRKKDEMDQQKPAGTSEGDPHLYMNWQENGRNKELTLFITSLTIWKIGDQMNRLILYARLDPEMTLGSFPKRFRNCISHFGQRSGIRN